MKTHYTYAFVKHRRLRTQSMRFKTIAIFIAAFIAVLVSVVVALNYCHKTVAGIAVVPDTIVLGYRSKRVGNQNPGRHEVSISRIDSEWKSVSELLTQPGRVRVLLDITPFMEQMSIHTPTIMIDFIGNRRVEISSRSDPSGEWTVRSRLATSRDLEIIAELRARCEKNASTQHKPHWVP